MEMIPFYLIFPNVVLGGGAGFAPQSPFSTYILSETRNYVYIIFCANTIISFFSNKAPFKYFILHMSNDMTKPTK